MRIFRQIFLALLFMNAQVTFAQPAPECLKITEAGTRSDWENVCDEDISVAYCSADKPMWGKKCGDGGKKNVFYTHMKNMARNEKSNEAQGLRVAPCRGYLNSWDLKGRFTSNATGGYDCSNPAKKETTDTYIYTAKGASDEEACKNALAMAGHSGAPGECTCQSRAKVSICHFAALEPGAPESIISNIKQRVRKMSACKSGETNCTRSRVVSIGVRG